MDIWLGAVAGVVWGTLLGGVSGAAGFAVAYGVLLRAWRVHRAVLSCAGTTWVLGSAALRVVLCDECVSPVVENDGLVAAIAAFGVVVLLWRTDLLPFGLDWSEFPFVGVELQPVLLEAFPDRGALRSTLRLNWVREWDAWGDTVVGVRVAETAADRERVAGDFVRRLQSLVVEHDPMLWSADGAGSPPTSPTDGVGSDVEMWDAEDGKEERIIEWTEFPFVGLELRPLLRDAFPDPRDLRHLRV